MRITRPALVILHGKAHGGLRRDQALAVLGPDLALLGGLEKEKTVRLAKWGSNC